MFKDDLKLGHELVQQKINDIIRLLTDQNMTKSHSRHIPMPVCQSTGLKIVEMEKDHDLQDIILSIHHASALTIMNTPAIKIIENQNGQAYISGYSKTSA